MARITIEKGDITKANVDAIVNAANQRMLGGGGVDGAIHRAAGPELRKACERVPEVEPEVRCPTGEARVTSGFELPAKYVIHTVGPVYGGREEDAAMLAAAYRSSLESAVEQGVKSIAFPAISCGVYGYPVDEAARVAISVAKERDWPLDEIRFVLFSDEIYQAWQKALNEG